MKALFFLQSKEGSCLYTAREFFTRQGAEKWKKKFERAFPVKKFYISTRPCKGWDSDKMMMQLAGISSNPEKDTMEI